MKSRQDNGARTERLEAFAKNGVEDPIKYQTPTKWMV